MMLSGKATLNDYEEAIARGYGSVLDCNKTKASLRYWKKLRMERKKN